MDILLINRPNRNFYKNRSIIRLGRLVDSQNFNFNF